MPAARFERPAPDSDRQQGRRDQFHRRPGEETLVSSIQVIRGQAAFHAGKTLLAGQRHDHAARDPVEGPITHRWRQQHVIADDKHIIGRPFRDMALGVQQYGLIGIGLVGLDAGQHMIQIVQ